MKPNSLIALAIAGVMIVASGCSQVAHSAATRPADLKAADLEAGFHNPPESARSLTFWMWMNGNISKEGITADLEAFKRAGLAGTQQFLIGGAEADLDDPSLVFLSDKWRGLEKFAETESARLGLEFGTHNCGGWSSSGGPWIKPEQSMQQVVSGEATFKGPGHFEAKLPTGKVVENYYADIAVLAFQTSAYTGRTTPGLPKGGTGEPPVGASRGMPIASVARDSIIDISSKLSPDGTLAWDAPAGDWTIVRFGHTSTGQKNVASPIPAQGLECDKLSKAGIEAHYANYPQKLLDDAGPLAGTTFKRFEVDSYEAGPQDWTEKMRQEFQARRGYDMTPYLVYLTKRNITEAGQDVSERFRTDYNRTIAELYAENYYGHLDELIHKTPGLELMYEPYNTSRFSPMETNNLSQYGDVLAAEFWQRPSTWGWNSVKTVTSGAHTWGKSLVAAESFTGQPDHAFQSDPYKLKATGDRAYALGVNRLVFHTSAMQPWMNVAPGMTMGQWGTHFGRTITWWDHGAKEWINYQARSQFLLQQGVSVSDLCFLAYDRRDPVIPAGYDGDTIGTDSVERLTVVNGRLTLPGGASYAAIVLPERTAMTPQLLTKLHALVNDGGTIIGPKPTESSSLQDYPACDQRVTQLAGELWGDADGKTITEHAFGKGHVYWGVKPEDVLAKLNVPYDVELTPSAAREPYMWIHRRTADADIYFISNQTDDAVSTDAVFRIAGKVPELWHAETDTVEDAPIWSEKDGRTHIPLSFGPSGSVFVMFRRSSAGVDPVASITRDGKPDASVILKSSELTSSTAGEYTLTTASGKTTSAKVDQLPAPLDLSANWTVSFPPKLGAPLEIKLDKLMNLSEHETTGVKYFSGTMTYFRDFTLPAELFAPGRVLNLDLGTVKNVAEVRVNGKDLPLMWLPPFRADATSLLHPGTNTVEVKVTNLWMNRLIGDEQLPDDLQWGPVRKLGKIISGQPLESVPAWINDPTTRPSKDRVTFITYKSLTKDSPLPQSGLIGPVTVQAGQRVEIKHVSP